MDAIEQARNAAAKLGGVAAETKSTIVTRAVESEAQETGRDAAVGGEGARGENLACAAAVARSIAGGGAGAAEAKDGAGAALSAEAKDGAGAAVAASLTQAAQAAQAAQQQQKR